MLLWKRKAAASVHGWKTVRLYFENKRRRSEVAKSGGGLHCTHAARLGMDISRVSDSPGGWVQGLAADINSCHSVASPLFGEKDGVMLRMSTGSERD